MVVKLPITEAFDSVAASHDRKRDLWEGRTTGLGQSDWQCGLVLV